jgi:hypothetical protein
MTRSRQTADWGSRAGLAKIVPSSVAVGSGTGSANTLGTVTFSGCSSVSLNGIFSATYDNYQIVANFVGSTGIGVGMRIRNAGTDETGSYYYFNRIFMQSGSTSITGYAGDPQTRMTIGEANIGNTIIEILIANPATSKTKNLIVNMNGHAATESYLGYASGFVDRTTAYDGLTILPDTGTITGTIRVYGFNN